MGKIIYKCDRVKTPKPRRKRRKKDLDKIHLEFLKAREHLDNVGKNNKKYGQKRQGSTRISTRFLPKAAVGIYRNGAKSKDIRNADIRENFDKARLEADALKLFHGGTPESKCTTKRTVHHETIDPSSNTKLIKNNLEWTPTTLEQSPTLTNKQSTNQRLRLIKKKDEENPFKIFGANKTIKQNAKNESKYTIQRDDTCKRRLFENDREQLKTLITPPQTQICNNSDISKRDKMEKDIHARAIQPDIPLENNSNTSWAPLNRYKELCSLITAENFGTDFLQNYESDPVITTVKKLRYTYSDSFRQQIWRQKIKLGLLNADSTSLPVEYQACSYTDNSQFSIVEFEVPKCSEDHIDINHLREGMCSKNDKIYINTLKNARIKPNENITLNNSTPYSSYDTSALYNVSSSENQENNDKHTKVSLSIQSNHPSSKQPPINFYFKNEKDYVRDSQKNLNLDISPQNNTYIDIPSHAKLRYHNKVRDHDVLFHINSILPAEEYSSKDQSYEKLSLKLNTSHEQINTNKNCTSNNIPQQYVDGKTINTHKSNVNIKRIPTILRRCNDTRLTKINKISHHVQIKEDRAENVYKESEKDMLKRNGTSSNNIVRESYKVPSPAYFQRLMPITSLLTPNKHELFDPHIIATEIKNPQESKLKEWDWRSSKSNAKNKFNCSNNFLHPHNFDTLHNTNTYTNKLVQQQEIDPDTKKPFIHSNNDQLIFYTQNANPSNFIVKPVKQSPQQIRSPSKLCQYTCEVNNSKQEFFNARDQKNQNILFKDLENRATSTATSNCSCNIQTDKNNDVSEKMFDKMDIEYAKMLASQNACQRNVRHTYFDSVNYAERCNSSCLTHRANEEAMQTKPETLYNVERCNNITNNNVNLQNGIQNVQLLSLEQKCNSYTHSNMTDNQHHAVDTVRLQNVTQPVKYLAVKNGMSIQRIPIYINNGNAGITENLPLKVVTLASNNQTKPFSQQITTQAIPLQPNLQFDEFTTHKKNNPPFVRRLDCVKTVLLNPDLQSNTWYASNL